MKRNYRIHCASLDGWWIQKRISFIFFSIWIKVGPTYNKFQEVLDVYNMLIGNPPYKL